MGVTPYPLWVPVFSPRHRVWALDGQGHPKPFTPTAPLPGPRDDPGHPVGTKDCRGNDSPFPFLKSSARLGNDNRNINKSADINLSSLTHSEWATMNRVMIRDKYSVSRGVRFDKASPLDSRFHGNPNLCHLGCSNHILFVLRDVQVNGYLSTFSHYSPSSAESQKGINAVQRCSVENQKGAIAILIDFVQR